MSYTKIKLKSGPTSNFPSNLGNGLREPIWSSDSGYNRLFLTNGTASAPTIVNPVVRYNEREAGLFPWNTLVSLDNSGEGFISYPIITSGNASSNEVYGYVAGYSFTTTSISFTVSSLTNDSWNSYTLYYDSSSIASGSIPQGTSTVTITSVTGYTIQNLYTLIENGTGYLRLFLETNLGKTYYVVLKTGQHDSTDYSDSVLENNLKGYQTGKDAMEVSFGESIFARNRILFNWNSYYRNTTDACYNFQQSRIVYTEPLEENLAIGGGNSYGTLTLSTSDDNGTTQKRSVTLIPNANGPKDWREVNPVCVLPSVSGIVAVFEQRSMDNGTCDRIVLGNSSERRLNFMSSLPLEKSFLTCKPIGYNYSYEWTPAGSVLSEIEATTYSELVSMVNNNALVKGQKYRITDYITTADRGSNISTDTYTAINAHAFDLVVTAVSDNKLDHRAVALPNSTEDYYTDAGADLTKWQVWYDIKNNRDKYFWANTTSGVGKGVIYRLIDEWGNDCPYDFKNIQFKRKLTDGALDTASGTNYWVYTFNAWNEDESVCEDLSLITMSSPIDDGFNYCSENTMGICVDFDMGGPRFLNDNVFLCSYSPVMSETYVSCCSNSFGNNSTHNTLGAYSEGNTFMESCSHNTIGYSCLQNTFAKLCGNNFLGSHCSYNTFGVNCHNNTLYDYSSYNTFGSDCDYIVFANSSGQGGTFFRHNVIENGNQYIRLYQTTGTAGINNQLQNVYIAQGVSGAPNNYVEISTVSRNLAYRTTVAPEPGKPTPTYPPRIYCEDEIVQADWNQTTNSAPDYIKNKPAIPSITLVTWTNS